MSDLYLYVSPVWNDGSGAFGRRSLNPFWFAIVNALLGVLVSFPVTRLASFVNVLLYIHVTREQTKTILDDLSTRLLYYKQIPQWLPLIYFARYRHTSTEILSFSCILEFQRFRNPCSQYSGGRCLGAWKTRLPRAIPILEGECGYPIIFKNTISK